MHACKTGHGSDARVVSDRGALSVELKGGKPTKDDEAWLGFGREGGNAGDEGFDCGGAVGVAEALDDCSARGHSTLQDGDVDRATNGDGAELGNVRGADGVRELVVRADEHVDGVSCSQRLQCDARSETARRGDDKDDCGRARGRHACDAGVRQVRFVDTNGAGAA